MTSPFNRSAGARLRHQRKLRGMTQQQLAERLGISFQQLQKYETGANTMSFERVCQLSALLGAPLDFFRAASAAEEPIIPAGGQRLELSLLRAYHAIPAEENRRLLCQLARALAGAGNAVEAPLALPT